MQWPLSAAVLPARLCFQGPISLDTRTAHDRRIYWASSGKVMLSNRQSYALKHIGFETARKSAENLISE